MIYPILPENFHAIPKFSKKNQRLTKILSQLFSLDIFTQALGWRPAEPRRGDPSLSNQETLR